VTSWSGDPEGQGSTTSLRGDVCLRQRENSQSKVSGRDLESENIKKKGEKRDLNKSYALGYIKGKPGWDFRS